MFSPKRFALHVTVCVCVQDNMVIYYRRVTYCCRSWTSGRNRRAVIVTEKRRKNSFWRDLRLKNHLRKSPNAEWLHFTSAGCASERVARKSITTPSRPQLPPRFRENSAKIYTNFATVFRLCYLSLSLGSINRHWTKQWLRVLSDAQSITYELNCTYDLFLCNPKNQMDKSKSKYLVCSSKIIIVIIKMLTTIIMIDMIF